MQPISRVFRRSEKHFRFYDLENSDAAHHLLWGSKSGGRNWDDFFPWQAKQYMLCSRVKYIVGFHALLQQSSRQNLIFLQKIELFYLMDLSFKPFFPLINPFDKWNSLCKITLERIRIGELLLFEVFLPMQIGFAWILWKLFSDSMCKIWVKLCYNLSKAEFLWDIPFLTRNFCQFYLRSS